MLHTDLFYETPKEEATESDKEAARRLDIPAEAMSYIMQVWLEGAYEIRKQRKSR